MTSYDPRSAIGKHPPSAKRLKPKGSRLYRGGVVPSTWYAQGRFTREEIERAVDAALAKHAEAIARID